MNRLIKGFFAVALIMLVSGMVGYAEDWTIYGPRAQGMGGTGVAVGDEATASYWNPAAITLNDSYGLYIPFGTTLSAEGDVMQSVDAVFQVTNSAEWSTITSRMDSGLPIDDPATPQNELQTALDLFTNKIPAMNQEGQGLLFNLNGGLTIGLGKRDVFGGNIGLFGDMTTNAGIATTVDLNSMMSFSSEPIAIDAVTNMVGVGADHTGGATPFTNPASQALANSIFTIFNTVGATQDQAEELVYQAELAGVDTSDPAIQSTLTTIAQATATTSSSTATSNTSGVTLGGINVTQLGVTYGTELMEGKLALGGNFKLMQGETFYKFYSFDDLEEGGDFAADITDAANTKKTTTFGVDIGALYKVGDMVKLGLTGRNINVPKFAWEGPGDYQIDAQYRFGASLKVPMLLLSLDYDLNKTKSQVLNGYESQMFGLGAEINLIGFLFLRAGMSQNKAISGSGRVYTFGTSVNLLLFKLDLAVAQATDKISIESGSGGQEIPERAGVSFALSFRY